jgi:hypothetical protein
VPDYKPPDTVTLSIYTGTPEIVGSVPSGMADAIKSAVEMTLTLPLVNKHGYDFGYDKDTRTGPIQYYLEFTPTGASRAFRAEVIIRCNGVPSVGWDDGQVYFPGGSSGAPTEWPLTGQSDYKLLMSGWGKRTTSVLADFNIPEDGAESSPVLHQVQLCSPPLLDTTKTYWYGCASYADGSTYIAAVKKISTGVESNVYFSADCYPSGVFTPSSSCACMKLVIPPSTPPP